MRVFLYAVFFAMASVIALGQSKGTKTVLSYTYHGHGFYAAFIDATSVDGACSITVISSTGNGASRTTGPLDPATFAKLMAGVSQIEAISAAGSIETTGELYHVIETLVQNKDGSKSEKHVIPEKDAPEAFRAWLKLLSDLSGIRL